MQVEELIRNAIIQKIDEIGAFLVEIKVTPSKIVVELDKVGGITIGECTSISRSLTHDESLNTIFEKHELEVGSPGMGNPFRVYGQYQKSVGRNVKVKLNDGMILNGKIVSVNESVLEIQENPIKKNELGKIVKVPFVEIKETRLSITF